MSNANINDHSNILAAFTDVDLVMRLESLDDVIFPAIDGDPGALEASEPAWHQAVADLGFEAIQESRCEYLRYAQSTWQFLNAAISTAATTPPDGHEDHQLADGRRRLILRLSLSAATARNFAAIASLDDNTESS